MNAAENMKERRIAWFMLIFGPLSMMTIFIFVTAGLANGLDAGHPMEYLQATCVLWALIIMVLPILRLMNLVALPLWFMIMIYADMYLYVISLCNGMYLNISWWGDLTHILASMVVAALVFIALCLMESHSPGHATLGSSKGVAFILFFASMSFGAIWELMEGFTDAIFGKSYMAYGASDTLGDLTADMIGAFIVTIAVFLMLKRQSISNIASKIRFRKKAFEIEDT